MPFYGLENLDSRIADYLPAKSGSFVELGAYDGITQSNTLHFEERGWRGILIEPVHAAFVACTRNRPLARVFNCACVPFDHAEPTVKMTAVGLMSLVNGTLPDRAKEEAWIARGESVQSLKRAEIIVPARTLDSILVEAQLPHPDLLVLDVEGAELRVLSGLDFRVHRPRFIVCEDSYTTEVSHFLHEVGYTFRAVLLERKYTRDVLYCEESR